MTTWFRLALPVRLVIVVVVWFGYAVLVSDLNALDSGSRSAKLIWTACLVGAALTVGVDPRLRPKRRSIEQFMAYRRALRTGELSAPLDAAWWRRHLWIARLQTEIKRRAAATAQVEEAVVTQEEAYFRTPRGKRMLVIAAMGFTFAFLALVVADLDSVIYSNSRIVHLEWTALFAALMGLSAIAHMRGSYQRGRSSHRQGNTLRRQREHDDEHSGTAVTGLWFLTHRLPGGTRVTANFHRRCPSDPQRRLAARSPSNGAQAR